MIRSADRLARPAPARAAPARTLALALALAAAPLAAQQTFSLPPASPTPTPVPAGPADERGGVAIPPRAVPGAAPSAAPSVAPSVAAGAAPTAIPVIQPLPAPGTSRPPLASPAPTRAPAAAAAGPATAPSASASATTAEPTASPLSTATGGPAPGFAPGPSAPPVAATRPEGAPLTASLPVWWPFAAAALGALVLLAGGALVWRRRKPKVLRLAAPAEGAPAAATPVAGEPPRLDITLEITAATRSLMMFTLEYRLTAANRSQRAVTGLKGAVQLACARASAAPSAGAAQALAAIDRVGPHQARSMTGTVQLPLSAIAPLRQGQTPLFVPLVHVTLEGEGFPAQARTFVIGTPSASGRVHPIPLDTPPGGIPGLVAQAVAAPAAPSPSRAPAPAAA